MSRRGWEVVCGVGVEVEWCIGWWCMPCCYWMLWGAALQQGAGRGAPGLQWVWRRVRGGGVFIFVRRLSLG